MLAPPSTTKDAVPTENILCLTADSVLALDLAEAMAQVGLALSVQPTVRASIAAVIVDAESLGRRSAAALRHHARRQRPVILISDTPEVVRPLGVQAALVLDKPLSTDDLAAKIRRLLGLQAEAGI